MKQGRGERAVRLLAALGKSACYLGLFVGMQVLVMMPLMLASGIVAAMGEPERAAEIYNMLYDNSMLFSALSGLLTIVVVLLFYLIRRKKLNEALWLRRVDGPVLLSGAALAPSLYVLATLALMALPEAWLESYNEASSNIGTGGLVGIAAVVLVAPVAEEFIFRGLIMTRLSRAMPGWLAAALSAAIFGICHGHPVWIAYTFVLGLLFGLMDLRAGSIWPSILSHMVFNAIGQALSLVPETEEGMEALTALGVVLVVGVIALILDRKGIAALFRPAPKAAPEPAVELPAQPDSYDYDPWEE